MLITQTYCSQKLNKDNQFYYWSFLVCSGLSYDDNLPLQIKRLNVKVKLICAAEDGSYVCEAVTVPRSMSTYSEVRLDDISRFAQKTLGDSSTNGN